LRQRRFLFVVVVFVLDGVDVVRLFKIFGAKIFFAPKSTFERRAAD